MDVVKVLVHTNDELTDKGVTAMLSSDERLRVVPNSLNVRPDIVVVAVDGVARSTTFASLRRFQGGAGKRRSRAVVIADRFRSEDLLLAIECGVTALLFRTEVKEDMLASVVLAVSCGAAVMSPRLQGSLLEQIGQLQAQVLIPAGLTLAGIEERERDVLQLVAEGYSTEEIGARLTYSEGTVKNVLYGLMARLHFNSRSQAVAYALRAGVI
ncbi:response regulator transcription factor [Amycolatopsis sp. cg5]|uniref:helix-turn-helix transcriptional regulator n=1 Tax=Amycolatopsis sp. cg5 TaxID=3238802 RepID=UPI00352521BA